MVHASSLVPAGDDHRNSSFVRVSEPYMDCNCFIIICSFLLSVYICKYEMLVDRNARYRNLPVVLEPAIFFGQVQHIIVIHIGPSEELDLQEPETIILAAIRTCADSKTLPGGSIYYYSREGSLEVVDVNCIQCGVGRIKDEDRWAIVDQSGEYVHPVFTD